MSVAFVLQAFWSIFLIRRVQKRFAIIVGPFCVVLGIVSPLVLLAWPYPGSGEGLT